MTDSRILTDWSDVLRAGSAVVGGKGWHLAKLAQSGLPVPEGIVVPVSMEQDWLSQIDEPCRLDSINHEDKQARFHKALLNRALPLQSVDAIAQVLEQKNWLQQPLAVRSSATAEDSARTSFAGIHLSRLNVVGLQALVDAVREVWASRWLPEALAYRKCVGMAHDEGGMAVVIMPMQKAVASGIAFTCDPLSGRDDRLIIHANWGLGESLVGGHTDGDEAKLAINPLDDGLRILSYAIGRKSKTSVLKEHGTALISTPAVQADKPVMSEEQAVQLGRLVRNAAVALNYASPMYDLEWSWDGQRFCLLQARPVTAKARNTYPSLVDQPDIWSRSNTCEVLPDPMSAYDWSVSRRLVNLMLEENHKLIGYPTLPGAQRAGLFHGRLYLNVSLLQWESYDAFGVPPKKLNSLLGGHQPEIEVTPPGFIDKLGRVKGLLHFVLASNKRRRDADKVIATVHAQAKAWRRETLPASEQLLFQRLLEQIRYTSSVETLFFLQVSSGGNLSLLLDIINKYLPGEGHALTAALLAGGEPSITAQQAYDLADLALSVKHDAAANTWLNDPHRSGEWHTALAPESPFRTAFDQFLERYGHRTVYESYFRHPRWRESPEYLLDTITGLMQQDVKILQRQRLKNAQIALKRIRQHLPRWTAPLIHSLKKAAIRDTNHREAARSALVSLMEPQRRILLTIGVRWTDRNIMKQPDEIFNLTISEICDTIDGVIDPQCMATRISERCKLLEQQQSMSVEEVILRNGGAQSSHSTQPITQIGQGNLFHGVAVGTGKAKGVVRILHSPEEGIALEPGEVLAAPSTDPAWTPLFLKAGALVLETGGYLSHGAIVAREFGIPAVVNLPGILDQLKTGDLVEVDGFQGQVVRIETSN
ncbi:MAG: phosphoenolpyruvate-utilizing protein [Candidatus Thiodiazotropha sp. (ex Notomyrtea botanica)]|nr:phosphoenolpyruvate-utilizing protein [Candidatus Thiodiazotropha sp. (ex Notomyrtea botanica)]